MIRVVLGVALAVALVAVTTPALEDARESRSELLAERELGRVEAVIEELAREEAPGARRTLTLSLPGDSPTEASLSFVALGGVPGNSSATATDTAEGDLLVFRVAGGPRHVRRVAADLRVVSEDARSAVDSRALVLRGGETYEVTLRVVRSDGRRIVVVSVR
ncbi:DUF7311 family protein [Halorussus lipolyticus]|uniref:DUF7311 family protein n=1 Tax=Halorussus lipolyticus TaxID=3034024 RepID=UPI0023E80F69|nr:hypothetical protein [Halorussus sp. DT80]